MRMILGSNDKKTTKPEKKKQKRLQKSNDGDPILSGRDIAEMKDVKISPKENDVPSMSEAIPKGGMIVYGVGAHFTDMLGWHKDLAGRIIRVIDKGETKIGNKAPGLDIVVESPEVLRHLPAGTQVAVSALRYYEEIIRELHELNPGLVCPNLDQVVASLQQAEGKGMLVYGVGAHLADMLDWHPDLAGRIGRVFDKDEAKTGQKTPGVGVPIESVEKLKYLPAGTRISIAAIRYYDEIEKEMYALNPGLICQTIDDAYASLPSLPAKKQQDIELVEKSDLFDFEYYKKYLGHEKNVGKTRHSAAVHYCLEGWKKGYNPSEDFSTEWYLKKYPDIARHGLNPLAHYLRHGRKEGRLKNKFEVAIPKSQQISTRYELTDLQRQRLRGKDAQARWRQRFLLNAANCRRIFWGTRGVRASYLRREFQPLMGRGDIFIEEDLSLRGQVANGLPICIPDALKDVRGKFVIIVLDGNYTKVRERLLDYGYVENVDFVEGRQLLGEDENGYIDVPCVDKTQSGMIVYGLGAHLADMLKWHPELAGRISRVIDKDPKKTGTIAQGIGVPVEPPAVLRDLPNGTEVSISAIKYLTEIEKEIHAIQPGAICRSIDQIWQEYVWK